MKIGINVKIFNFVTILFDLIMEPFIFCYNYNKIVLQER